MVCRLKPIPYIPVHKAQDLRTGVAGSIAGSADFLPRIHDSHCDRIRSSLTNKPVFPGFLTPVLTQLSFQSHRLLFSHASAEVRGVFFTCFSRGERKESSPQPGIEHNHQVMSPTRSPLSHQGWA